MALPLLSAVIPDSLMPVEYFLSAINTPFWHWVFRGAFLVGLVGAIWVYFFYSRKHRK